MAQYLFKGLPQNVVTYIKIHLHYIYSTGLFDYQEREDIVQDLVLFYLEFIRKRGPEIPNDTLFMAIKSKAMHLGRTRLREKQSGFFNKESLNSMFEKEGFELEDTFSLADIENKIEFEEKRKFLSDKQNQFVDLILNGETVRNARNKLRISHTVLKDIDERIKRGKIKK